VTAEAAWPKSKLSALRLGGRLVAEVPSTGPGRRAFVEILPLLTPADEQAEREGWKRSDRARVYRVRHWDYDADYLDGEDYDLGAVLVRQVMADGEAALTAVLGAWGVPPERFDHPWRTDAP